MGDWKGEERRTFPRISGKIPVKYRALSNISKEDFENLGQKIYNTSTKNFSTSGLCIVTNEIIPPNTILEIILAFPEHKIKAIGRVVWSEETEPGKMQTGVDYLSIENNQASAMAQSIAEFLINSYKIDDEKGVAALKKTLTSLFYKNK
ncbi:hypothetical protein COY52_03020 [Candidatus Desantisbacteria bacterium CG_4_10_14_0_8_um_filter_48_22]|uniref:PilZ domain-containing protein n=1 Tax=Candidatus Desantisbacteria bacterium CG_4_10_14_0_8_um_filter_48_22 TaxID=1974543 RepID=A0A2M7SE72_9BACT|nr:MAG: hypothetical protein AUJ67_02475 [Candidatus Desantisbacteria bacterium CG1_02_49_89]PIV57429.1 MAG: hypothetical protein COS16_00055 [Candidatus Desantisbacteria bacterium CG02_land_8_20_14_3_00_49_13]PIZ17789.1 MAG: hypothetical protein COY52_03020 [Candidatus Desantisbacteria bacterium CG_4_10_14_0_8_um_filter_48_22]PJB27542.1 MAG: hypothetical protein CO111_04805 [Candidatus Desantisbacteria bacterium CG_4_9_14_3_um_filter_50_7]